MDDPKQAVSFIVRIWLEPSQAENRWRGHIRHVQSGQDSYFQDLRRMREFMETIVGQPFPGSRPEEDQRSRERSGGGA